MQPSGPVAWCGGFRAGEAWVRVLALPLVGCVTVGECVNLPEHRFLTREVRMLENSPPGSREGSVSPPWAGRPAQLWCTCSANSHARHSFGHRAVGGPPPVRRLGAAGEAAEDRGLLLCPCGIRPSEQMALSGAWGTEALPGCLWSAGPTAAALLPDPGFQAGGLGPGQLTEPGGRGLGGQLRPWSGAESQIIP